MDLKTLSDEQLDLMIKQKQSPRRDLSSIPDDELDRLIAAKTPEPEKPKYKTLPLMGEPDKIDFTPEGIIREGAHRTAKDILAIPAHYVNQALINIPRATAHTLGYEYPEKTYSKVASVAARGAGIVGGVTSPIFRGVRMAGKLLPRMMKGAATAPFYGSETLEETIKPQTIATKATAGAIGAAVLPPLIGKVSKVFAPVAKKVDDMIDVAISKAIRPSVVGKRTYSDITKYKKQARDAIKTIHEDKTTPRPRNLDELSQAIHKNKTRIFSEYNALQEGAGQKGAIIDLKPVANTIRRAVSGAEVKDFNPEVVKYAKELADALEKRGKYTPEEAQNAIELLNSRLKSFYKAPDYNSGAKAVIDSAVVNNLRKNMDITIEATTGEGYQALKRKYGSLATLERDLNKRLIVDARKNVKGFFDITDVFSSGEIVRGLLTMRPENVAAGLTMRAAKTWYKHVNDPNVIIKNLFSQMDKTISRGKAFGGLIKTLNRQFPTPRPGAEAGFTLGGSRGRGNPMPRLVPERLALPEPQKRLAAPPPPPPQYKDLGDINSKIKNYGDMLPSLRKRGMTSEVKEVEKALKTLFDIQAKIYREAADSRRLKSAIELVK